MPGLGRVRSVTPRKFVSKVKGAVRRLSPRPEEAPAAAPAWLLAPVGPAARTDPPGPKVILLNDCRDQVNFGASVLVEGLFEILSRSLPTATILPIPSYWLMDLDAGEPFVGNGAGFRQPSATFPALADQFDTVADAWMNGAGGRGADVYLRRLEGADLVVLNGEGSMYRTNVSAIRELFLAWLAKERLGIPTIFVNGMVHLTGVVPVLPAMVRKTFSALDAVAVREPCSLRNVREYAPGVDVRVFPDSAFVCTPDEARETPAVRSVRAAVGGSAYFCFDPGAMPMDHRPPRRSGLYELISRLKDVVPTAVFVNSAPADAYIRAIADETESLYVDTLTDYREYMALVAGAQFVASGRYHNPLLAALMGCPSITFSSSSHKVHGACEMLDNIIGTPYDGTDLRTHLDAIEQQARGYVEHRDDLRARLLELCARRRAEALEIGELAADVLRRHAAGAASSAEAAQR